MSPAFAALVKTKTSVATIQSTKTTEHDAAKPSHAPSTEPQQMLRVKEQLSASNKIVNNSMHYAMGPFLVVARFFGVLPVMGVWPSSDVEKVHFHWKTLPMLMATISVGLAITDFCLTFRVLLVKGLKLTTTAPLSFSVECLSAFLVFLCLARNWPTLIKSTKRLESVLSHDIYTSKESQNFSERIRFIGWTLIFCSTIEHCFYIVSGMYSNHVQIEHCNFTVSFFHNYYMRERFQIFSLFNYTVWLIPMVQWTTTAMTFTWNFVDIFLILVCRGLAARLRQFHWCIQRHIKQKMSNEFWQKIRKDFLLFNSLFGLYDEKLSALILLSSAQNLYFLAVQIYHSFLNHGNFMNDMYFWVSFIYVAFRAYFMMSTAASIHDVACEIKATIFEIPTEHWCLELKRINEVIVSDLFALSGKGFFFLTKRLIFAMAGTLVVYELVLMDQVDSADVATPFCNQLKG